MLLLETMFEAPSKKDIKEVRIFKEVITEGKHPKITYLEKTKKEKSEASLTIVPGKEKSKEKSEEKPAKKLKVAD